MIAATDINIDIEYNDKQWKADIILKETLVSILGYGGARGGGKSYFGRTEIITDLLEHPGSTGLIIRKTFSELERNHIKKIKKEWPKLIQKQKEIKYDKEEEYTTLYKYKEQKHYFEFANGSQLDLTYCENIKDLEKLQGAEYDFILLDEAEHYSEVFFQDICACLRTVLNLKCYIIVTFNPGGIGQSWLKRLFITKNFRSNEKPENYDFVKATVYDNPKIDEAYIDRLKALPERKRKAWLDGDFDSYIGQYFDNFGDHLKIAPFVIPPHESAGKLYGSMDYGYGINGYSSFGLWYNCNGVPIRLLTWFRQGLKATEQANDLYDTLTSFHFTSGALPIEVVCDTNMWTDPRLDEHSKAPIDYFKEKFPSKVKWIPANKNRINGWQVVLDYFSIDQLTQKPKMLYVDKYNVTMEETFPQLVSDDNRPEDVKKCDIDHTPDEVRYFLTWFAAKIALMVSEEVRQQSSASINREINKALASHPRSVTGW